MQPGSWIHLGNAGHHGVRQAPGRREIRLTVGADLQVLLDFTGSCGRKGAQDVQLAQLFLNVSAG